MTLGLNFSHLTSNRRMHATEGTYSKAPIIRTEHWAVLAVHSMYCRTGICNGMYSDLSIKRTGCLTIPNGLIYITLYM